jgi:integrase
MAKINPLNNNGSIRLRFYVDGKQYNISRLGKYSNRVALAKAEMMAAIIESDLTLGTFDESLNKYSESLSVGNGRKLKPRKLLEVWDSWVESLNLSEQTKSDHYHRLRSMITKANPMLDDTAWFTKASKELSSFTFNSRLRFLKNCLDFAVSQRLIDSNPYQNIKSIKSEMKAKTKPLTFEEMRLILVGFEKNYPDYLPIVSFLFLVGCRISEGIGLQVKRIDWKNETVTIADTLARVEYQASTVRKQTKTGAITTIPFNEALRTLLTSVVTPEMQPDDLVFNIKGRSIKLRTYQNNWGKVLKLVELPHTKAYSTRHTMISMALDQGMSILEVAALVGHKGSTMIDRHYGSVLTPPKLPDLDRT